MTIQPSEICHYLDWDSQFFHHRIARLEPSSLTRLELDSALEWCLAERIDCLYYLAPTNDFTSIHLAEGAGFHLVDIRMTFSLPGRYIAATPVDPQIRLASHTDVSSLGEIARQAYQSTRFFNDPHFSRKACERLYITWIEKSCQGYAQAVWVADVENAPVGFITCHLEKDHGQIGLVGIHPAHHQRGWGRKLVNAALNWFSSQNCHSVQVVTQGNNLPAQKLYAACGFSLGSVACWYHRWFEQSPEEGFNDRISDTL